MTEEQAKTYKWNPFDLTRVWSHKDFPLIDIVMELNENRKELFPSALSNRPLPRRTWWMASAIRPIKCCRPLTLLSRRTPLPPRRQYEQIPVNRCPFAVNNYERDGQMRVDENGGSAPNYFSNSFDDINADRLINNPPGNWIA